ncbi:SNO glutamine amidotransferase [Trichocladium antarcticum]|uniref:glutaminase n=1 Tax=Trichocladium antarcticum TaxID=1450529 RepID=A0AAN6UKZ2_9PEZI|nr:SNO glutamine amidotransferase [Trichocladium antarcticum]
MTVTPAPIAVGVLALQGGVAEHLALLRRAAALLLSAPSQPLATLAFTFTEVRTAPQLARCDALIIPGGESTTMAIVAQRLGLLDPLRDFVKTQQKPTWGTCAGLVLLSARASATKQGGQQLIGGLDVAVQRNRYGTQLQSFVAELSLPFLQDEGGEGGAPPFRGVFIRAPVVEEVDVAPSSEEEGALDGEGGQTGLTGTKEKEMKKKGKGPPVEVLGVYRGRDADGAEMEDIVAVRQGNVFGTSFHPELTDDVRIHVWWLRQVVDALRHGELVVGGV